jgi:hypothetical protein
MEGLVFETQYFAPTIAAAGLAVLLAVEIGGLVFSYIADEEAKGRRIDWLEEPLAVPGEHGQAQGIKLKKAA